jgi:HD-GYP domain-containing protein (c-di-GMP phosphodiesterase class II)
VDRYPRPSTPSPRSFVRSEARLTSLVRIRLAGLLHDVGKIGVPDSILQKPASLTHGEYEQMKGHSVLGAEIVEAADMPVEADWIRHHHERIDGTGYPDGQAGNEIPLESRIIHGRRRV